MTFNPLLSELHLHIPASLDLMFLLEAAVTSHYFHELVSSRSVKNALLADERILLDAETTHQLPLIDLCQNADD